MCCCYIPTTPKVYPGKGSLGFSTFRAMSIANVVCRSALLRPGSAKKHKMKKWPSREEYPPNGLAQRGSADATNRIADLENRKLDAARCFGASASNVSRG